MRYPDVILSKKQFGIILINALQFVKKKPVGITYIEHDKIGILMETPG